MRPFRRLLRSLCTAATVLLVACGGGGSDSPQTIGVSYNVASLTKAGLVGVADSLVVTVTLSPVPSGNVYVVVVADRPGLIRSPAFVFQTGANTFEATLSLLDTVPVGTYAGMFTFRLCRDPACATEYPLSGAALPYSIQVWNRVAIDVLQGGVLSHAADVASRRVVSGEQITLTSNVPVTWSKGSNLIGTDFQNVTSTPTQWTGQIVGSPGGFVGVLAQSIAVGDAQQVLFDISF